MVPGHCRLHGRLSGLIVVRFRSILALQTTFEVFTRVGPDNSLERLTERSVGLVTDRPSDVYELFVTLFVVTASPSASATRLHIPAVFVRVAL